MILTRRLVFWSTWFTLSCVCLESMSLVNGANRSRRFFFYWLGFCVKELIWFTLNSVCLEFFFIDPGQPIWPVTRSLYRSTSGSGLKTMCGLLHEFKLIIFIKIIIFFLKKYLILIWLNIIRLIKSRKN
jgi:hypothetical protein